LLLLCKMAEGKQLVVCAPLCFCLSKFGKLDRSRIKSVLNDFFPAEEITLAKNVYSRISSSLS
jgi:hypothetical protein